jgi:secreted PhoX family phosphatase
VSTSGGIGQGQIWEYDPSAETIRLLFQSPGSAVLNAPDNITVSPRGGLVLCEDGNGLEFMHGLTVEGEIFPFAQNNIVLNGERNGFVGDFRGSEWAGACYSPDGKWLFANIQSPGLTVAITGPWMSGAEVHEWLTGSRVTGSRPCPCPCALFWNEFRHRMTAFEPRHASTRSESRSAGPRHVSRR